MSTPDQVAHAPVEPIDADAQAAFASIAWFDWSAPRELVRRYEGMYVAILGEQVIDADKDLATLDRRLNACHPPVPMRRLVVKYVYTDEDDTGFGSRVG